MNQDFINVIFTISKIAPVVAVLWLAVRYFLKKERAYQEKIDEKDRVYQEKIDHKEKVYQDKINELQDELRNSEKASITVMNRLTAVLDKLITDTSDDKKEILSELNSIHKDLTRKLNEIKKG